MEASIKIVRLVELADPMVILGVLVSIDRDFMADRRQRYFESSFF